MNKCLVLLVLLLTPLMVVAEAGVTQTINPPGQQGVIISAVQIASMIADADTKLYDQITANNDNNFRQLDARVNSYMSNLQMRIMLVVIGVQLIVSGIVYYVSNKNMRDLSYQSINLKRKKESEDRAWMVDNINYVRDQVDSLQASMKNMMDSNLFNLEQLAKYRRENDDRSNRAPSGEQQSAVAQFGDVQGYNQQGAQGWVSDGQQYEQSPAGSGQYGGAYQQGGPGPI